MGSPEKPILLVGRLVLLKGSCELLDPTDTWLTCNCLTVTAFTCFSVSCLADYKGSKSFLALPVLFEFIISGRLALTSVGTCYFYESIDF